MFRLKSVFMLLGLFIFFVSNDAHAVMIITEILADPPAGLAGDANQDGVRDGNGDEFVEIFNSGPAEVNISSWKLKDSLSVRHIFPQNTFINPYRVLVIFGKGNPNLASINWQGASTGILSLNNSGDSVNLLDSGDNLVDKVSYGSEGGSHQSLLRDPETSLSNSVWILHKDNPLSQGKPYSAGYLLSPVEEERANSTPSAPEAGTMLTFLLGLSGRLFIRAKTYFV